MRESAARTAAQGGERDGRNGFLVSYTPALRFRCPPVDC
jgi:hypothetical protein